MMLDYLEVMEKNEMNYQLGSFLLRRPEPEDLKALYQQKNDPQIASLLGGFSVGYAMADLEEWLEYHRKTTNEALWVVVDAENSNECVGHVGLYNIDFRIGMAEFAILLGNPRVWGKGLGKACTNFALQYGFNELNLNRIYLSVLATNERAIMLYHSLRFAEEGRLRQAQYKNGHYVDVLLMSILREEYERP